MPELPEVETVKLQLQKYVVRHKIISIDVKNRKVFQGDEKLITGATFTEIRRFGKVLVFDLSNGYSIISHIKLTGQYIYRGPNLKNTPTLSKKVVGGVPGTHTHVIFNLDHGGILYYNDVRRFGWIKIVKTKDVVDFDFIKKLGPEPFGKLTLEEFKNIISKTKRVIKVVLMDQSKIGGIGNIYANDALWESKILPSRTSNSLNEDEQKDLYKAILKVLETGMKYGGASELSFVTPEGSEGSYQMHTLVYGKQKTKCKRCGTIIVKTTLGGRGTYFCPKCQK
ncbi:DNA-formamidopyrimidine glycosylase, partial [Candidatus Woesebacteria bacterium]|nr:DNA-formamidopyrimidine glycosylase [Candidatus Woesebacteria bacterium]QQG47559.1 MAG: DNA-formamidopyrimidine glycosylase [Candidatus Woesebacteria bacterium]